MPLRTGIEKSNPNSSPLTLICVLLVVFAAAPLRAQTFQDLYDFNGSGGWGPIDLGQLTEGSDGNLYGTTPVNGVSGGGTIFRITLPSVTYSDLYFFDGRHGSDPQGALTLASDGNFYGATYLGGKSGNGTIFRFTPPGTLTVLHNFTGASDGKNPIGAPVQGKDGNLYGVTVSGAAYRIALPSGTFKHLSANPPGGTYAPLYLASDGNLYGTSWNGGTYGYGSVFRISTTGAMTTVYSFTGGSDGNDPLSPLTQAADLNLYGTTKQGGSNGVGNLFQLSLSGQLTSLYSFDPPGGGFPPSNNDGMFPYAGVLAASDGYLYGANAMGGADGFGTLYLATRSGSAFQKIFDFDEITGPDFGANPYSTLVEHTNGCFYGVTRSGGYYNAGNFYSLCPAGPIQIAKVAGPIFVLPGVAVEIIGNNFSHAIQVYFGSVQAQFQTGSDTFLMATVPAEAVDAPISVILDTGFETQTQMAVHILPSIINLDPSQGAVGTQVNIVGGGFAGATQVTFGGGKTARFVVASPSMIQAVVPAQARTGKVTVTTPNGTATSPQNFIVN